MGKWFLVVRGGPDLWGFYRLKMPFGKSETFFLDLFLLNGKGTWKTCFLETHL